MAKFSFDELMGKSNTSLVTEIQTVRSNMEDARFKWERMWHENNFFDDGFHYRVISGDTRQVIDYADVASLYNPRRAIPKSSRQVRGMANLLLTNRPMPVIYPTTILKANFADEMKLAAARQQARQIAQRTGQFILDEWDRQEIFNDKLPYMLVLAARHSVSYLKIWPDPVEQAIRTLVRDAFDLCLDGELTSIYDCPIIVESYPELVRRVRANEAYDEDVTRDLVPDNHYSASKVKENYMTHKYGMKKTNTMTDTVTIHEAYIKEYLTDKLIAKIQKQQDAEVVLRNRKAGDPIIRQVVVTSNSKLPLRDVYTSLPDYPYADFRYEPGPIYGTPLLDRFKPANKALDNTVSRLERMVQIHTSGKYWTRDGQKPVITNSAAGEWIQSSTRPEVLDTPPFPAAAMELINLMTSYIEEQGVTTTSLGKLPSGVKAGVAIESLKSSEYSNLTIALEQLKKTCKHIAERTLDIVDDYFVIPDTVYYLNEGQPDYFDIVGTRGIELHKKLNQESAVQDAIPVSKKYKVKIEVESGLGYTIEGKRENADKLIDRMIQFMQTGAIPPAVVQQVIIEYLRTYQYGNLAEITEAFEQFEAAGGMAGMTNDQMMQMKLAMAEVLQDTGVVGPEAEQQQVNAAKVGTAEAINDIQS